MMTFSSLVYLSMGMPRTTLNPWPLCTSAEMDRRRGWSLGRGKVSWLMSPSDLFWPALRQRTHTGLFLFATRLELLLLK